MDGPRAYNRGSQSDASTASPPTAADIVADLKALLKMAGVPGPYVPVGHSTGGFLVQLYARTYPEDVVGIEAMNRVPPAHPWLDQALPLMTEDEQAEEEAYYRGEVGGEAFDFNTSSEQLEAAPAPPDIPFEMLILTIAQCDSPDDICGRTYEVYEAVIQGWRRNGRRASSARSKRATRPGSKRSMKHWQSSMEFWRERRD